jgi:hypothetical protein
LSDNGDNSDDGQAHSNVSNDDDGSGRGGSGDDDEDDGKEDWALWDNDHDFCKISRASSGCKPPQNRQMPDSPNEFFLLF